MKVKTPKINDRPTFGTVKRVNAIVNKWILKNVPVERLDMKKNIKEELMKLLEDDPNLRISFGNMMLDAESRRMAMLGTGLTEAEVIKLEDQLPFDDFEALLDEIKETLGIEKVEDFLQRLKKNTSTPTDEATEET